MTHLRPAMAALLLLLMGLEDRAPATAPPAPAATIARRGPAPPVMLWAWEEPEDLRTLDPHQAGVAFLADRLFLGRTVAIAPRRQRIAVPAGIYAEAVVRIEPTAEFADSPALRSETAVALLRVASLPNIHGLQIDFDATASQHAFYRAVLDQVRAELPHGLGLSMTALVSWCAQPDGWLRQLPVDAAIPMNFRLGQHTGMWSIREPLCQGSLGLSTDEPSTAQLPQEARIFLFAPHPWTAGQIARVNQAALPFDIPTTAAGVR